MIQAAAHLLAIGFWILLSGHKLCYVVPADLSAGEQCHQSASEELGKR